MTALIGLVAACSATTDGTRANPATPPRTSISHPPSGHASGSAPATVPGSSTGNASGASSTSAAPATPLRTVTAKGGVDGTTYVVKVWAQARNATCADHGYGKPVIAYLTKHPCGGMQRILATTTVGGRAVGFSEISLNIPGTANDPYGGAGGFRALVTKDGTGSVNDLLREGYRLPSGPTSVPTPDAFNALGQDSGVNIYDVWYLQGATPDNAKPLVQLTEDIFLQV